MYSVSSQKKNWTFESEAELAEMKAKRTLDFIETHGKHMNVSFPHKKKHFTLFSIIKYFMYFFFVLKGRGT